MLQLSSDVRAVLLQFSFSNKNLIPPWVYDASEKRRPTKEDGGKEVISATQDCSLVGFVEAFVEGNYKLVDAFTQERSYGNNPRSFYYIVGFVFVRTEFARVSESYMEFRDVIIGGLKDLCNQSFWRVRAYINPSRDKDGQEVPGLKEISINMEARKPRVDANGELIKLWERDEKGRKVGDKPLPLKPAFNLVLEGDEIKLISA